MAGGVRSYRDDLLVASHVCVCLIRFVGIIEDVPGHVHLVFCLIEVVTD